jgi:hypothetical protein
MKWINRIVLLLLFLSAFACKENKKRTEVEKIINEWVGKEIKFPDSFLCCKSGNDTVSEFCTNLFQAEYRILLYVDSVGCSSCRLKLFQWKQLIEEADSLFKKNLSFLLFFQPKSKKDFDYLSQTESFDYPVFLDMAGVINQLNQFPDKMEYQCFLLDKDNKVLMIGNPVLNQKIWELYKQQISGQTEIEKNLITMVSDEHSEIEITDLQVGKKSTGVFKLRNIGNRPLLIARVDASCGCTVPSWDKKPVEPGEEAEIRVEIQPEELGVFHKTIRVYCNVEKGAISLSIKGRVK